MEEASDLPWLLEPVQLRLHSGHLRYLLEVRKEPCCDCGSGTRIITFWACRRGQGEVVSWCGYCFNAMCQSAPLDTDQKQRFKLIRGALTRGGERKVWPAVRPALEELARRGWL